MIRKLVRVLVVISLTFVLILPPPSAVACGPFFPVTIFIQAKHPDLPLERYAAGELGVIQPSYARSYLAVAYRYFSGGSFTPDEQQHLMGLWAHRLEREQEWFKKENKDASTRWLDARRTVTGTEAPGYVKSGETTLPHWAPAGSRYFEYENCAEDAFLTAARTLKSRAKQFGPESRAVRSWIEAQDSVFENCDGANPATKAPYIPAAAGEELPAIIRSDREYQIAAAYFYAGAWDEAETKFLQISEYPDSPWRDVAALVAVRCRLRKIMLAANAQTPSKEDLAAVESRLLKLDAYPGMRKLRPAIWRMRGYVEYRLDPEKRVAELAKAIENGTNPANLRQDLDDYTQLLDQNLGEEPDEDDVDKQPSAATQSYTKSDAQRRTSQMTDWIITYQAQTDEAQQHALSKWKANGSLPWLLAVLAKEHGASPELAEILAAAAQVPADSPAYLTATFHRARLLAESGQQDKARQLGDSVLAFPGGKISISAKNCFLALRMMLARNLDEFLQFAPRGRGVLTSTEDGFELPVDLGFCKQVNGWRPAYCTESENQAPLFDSDAASAFTEAFPTVTLAEAVAHAKLPENLRRQVAQAAWVRAVLLDNENAGQELAPTLASLTPEVAPMLNEYASAQSPDARRFAAAFLILHRPEFHPYVSPGVGRLTPPTKIDDYRDNWWCSFGPRSPDDYGFNFYTMFSGLSRPLAPLYPSAAFSHVDFLAQADQKTAEKEWNELGEKGAAAAWLGSQTLSYAKKHPDDPRVPEALHLTVRATRYACFYKDPGNISKSAFMLLHKKYPASEWTRKTPFWY